MSRHHIILPLNSKGIEEIEYCIYDSPNTQDYVMPDNEFNYVYPNISEKFNREFDTLLDDYEDEVIPCEKLGGFRKMLDDQKAPVLCEALERAIELKMPLCFEW